VLGLRDGLVGEPVLEQGDLVAHVEQRLEREAGLFVQRVSAVAQAVLRQVPDREAGRLDDRAAVRLVESGEHLQERRLAGPIRASQADALPIVDLPADRVEQDAIAERFRQGNELDHRVGLPRM
jgi:hypothetical protein